MTPAEFAAKIDYEGGIFSALVGYGLSGDDLDDSDPELKRLVDEFLSAVAAPYERLQRALAPYEGIYEDY